MAEELGEVRVRIEEEGAQEAAETIGDATGQGSGAGGGGTVGGLLGGISTKLAGILALAGFLASLKPIQELLSGLQRLFSVAILPLVALLTTFLRPVLQKLLRFIGGLDFNNLVESLRTNLSQVLNNLVDRVTQGIANQFPNISGTDADRGAAAFESVARTGVLGPFGLSGNAVNVSLDWLNEQSNTSLTSNVSGTNAKVVQREGVGSE